MKKLFSVILMILFFVQALVGCDNHLSENGKISKSYLEKKNYKVVSYEGKTSIKFTKKNLQLMPNRDMWAVQKISPDKYIGKKIDVEIFRVKNHPLNKAYKNDSDFLNKIKVKVWIINGRVIGGTSFPVFKKNSAVVGKPYSLEGKTGEEVKGDLNKWTKKFKKKYGVKF